MNQRPYTWSPLRMEIVMSCAAGAFDITMTRLRGLPSGEKPRVYARMLACSVALNLMECRPKDIAAALGTVPTEVDLWEEMMRLILSFTPQHPCALHYRQIMSVLSPTPYPEAAAAA